MSAWVKKYWLPWLGFFIALSFHLWRLGQPATFVSDEFYFVPDSQHYLTQTYYLDAHPPLGKMEAAFLFTLAGSNPVTWRLINAVEGALLVPVVWWLAGLIDRRRIVPVLATSMMLVDGFLLAESRTGLINIPYILYSFIALACLLTAGQAGRSRGWLVVGGTMAGLALSVKWLAALVILPAVVWWYKPEWFGWPPRTSQNSKSGWLSSAFWLAVWPLAVYVAVFWVHFAWLGSPQKIVATNVFMFYHHTHGKTGHPYTQPWWGWLLMWQPFLYWVKLAGQKISLIWSMPNPWLWWTGAVTYIYSLIRRWDRPWRFLNIFLLANWLPFAFIQRDMFSYHAIPFSLFLILLLAVGGAELWARRRSVVIVYLGLAVLTWVWFLPWYLNLPLSPQQYRLRTWLPTWHVKSISLPDRRSTLPLVP